MSEKMCIFAAEFEKNVKMTKCVNDMMFDFTPPITNMS